MAIISSIKYELVISDFTFELVNKAGNTCDGGRFESFENMSDNEPKKDVEGVQVKNSHFIFLNRFLFRSADLPFPRHYLKPLVLQ